MKNIIIYLFVVIGLLHCQSCIDPLDVTSDEAQIILVVEGGISTLPGPHNILVTKSAAYGSRQFGEIILEANAALKITDDSGGQVFLTQEKPGSYLTPAGWQAEVGKSYTLFITLQNGERYASLPEKIVPVPALAEIIPVFKEFPSLSPEEKVVGIELYAKWDDPADEDNFYFWDTEGEYKLITFPGDHVGRDFFGNPFPDPLDCCDICYVKEQQFDRQLRVFKDNFSNGNTQTELVSFIEDDGSRFAETYMAVVKHQSLTKDAFQFYDILKNQLSISGDIFDPPTATIRGNMINLDEPEAATIGYFRATDARVDTVFLNRTLLDDPAPTVRINDDCRIIDGSTTKIPAYWPG